LQLKAGHTGHHEANFVHIEGELTMTETGTRGHQATGMSPRSYDWLSRAAGVSDAHWQLVAQAAIGPHATVLEIGAGTGNVLLKVKRAAPESIAIGLDPNTASLTAAARKAAHAGVELRLDHGDATNLPYPDATIDRVLSSFVLHHIPDNHRLAVLHEIRRVLKPDGSLHLLDFTEGTARGPLNRLLAALPGHRRHDHHQHDHGDGHHQPHATGQLTLLTQAGLVDPAHLGEGTSRFGRHAFYRACR
jgi:SAM-dependent methyltransferase